MTGEGGARPRRPSAVPGDALDGAVGVALIASSSALSLNRTDSPLTDDDLTVGVDWPLGRLLVCVFSLAIFGAGFFRFSAPAEPTAGLLRGRDRLLVFAALSVGGAFLLHQRPHLLLQRRVLSLGGDEILLQSLGHGVEFRRARLRRLPRLPRVRRRPRQVHRLPPPVLHELPPVVAYVVEGVAHSLRDCAGVGRRRSPQVIHHAVQGEEVEVALGVEEEGRAPGLVFGVRSLGARVRDDFLRGRRRVGTAVSDVLFGS